MTAAVGVLVMLFSVGGVLGATEASAAVGTQAVLGWGIGPDVPAGLTGVTAISAGSSHSLALKGDGTVVAWGSDRFGQTDIPAGLSAVVAIDAGLNHSLALKRDGTVVGWGYDFDGQIDVPAGLTGVTAIAAGSSQSLALKGDGTVVGWGDNGGGRAIVPAGLSGVTAIAAGVWHNLALKGDGTVVSWGYDGDGQIDVPAGLTGVTAISAGSRFSVALTRSGSVVSWGENYRGQTDVPAGLSGVTAISAGLGESLALKSNGLVVGWGGSYFGNARVPAGVSGVTAISVGTSSLVIASAWPVGVRGFTTPRAGSAQGYTLGSVGNKWTLAATGPAPTRTTFSGTITVDRGTFGALHGVRLEPDDTVTVQGSTLTFTLVNTGRVDGLTFTTSPAASTITFRLSIAGTPATAGQILLGQNHTASTTSSPLAYRRTPSS